MRTLRILAIAVMLGFGASVAGAALAPAFAADPAPKADTTKKTKKAKKAKKVKKEGMAATKTSATH